MKITDQLRRLAEKENRMRAEREVQNNPEWRTLSSQIKDVKHQLQIIRVNIKRKQYSIRKRQEALQIIQRSLAKFQSEESRIDTILKQLNAKVEQLRNAAMKRVSRKH
jgi:chromosome segregation ATPase